MKKIVFFVALATVLAMAVIAWRLRQAATGLDVTPSAAGQIEKAKQR